MSEDHVEATTKLKEQLEKDGWSVDLDTVDDVEVMKISHDVSMPYSYTFEIDAIDQVRLDEFLDHREFNVVRERPTAMPHTAFIGEFRKMAGSMNWPTSVVTVSARLLGVHGFLTSDEADWLELAGPAWRTDSRS